MDFNKIIKIQEVVKYCNYCNTIRWFDEWDINSDKPLYICKVCDMEAYQPQLFKEEKIKKT